MRKVFLSSPFSPTPERDIEHNLHYARECMLAMMQRDNNNNAIYAPHLIYPQVLEDKTHREYAMDCAKTFLKDCKELAVMVDFGISEGMKQEILWAIEFNIPIVFYATTIKGTLLGTHLSKHSFNFTSETLMQVFTKSPLTADHLPIKFFELSSGLYRLIYLNLAEEITYCKVEAEKVS